MARLSTLAMAVILFLVLSTTTTAVEVEGEVYGGLRKNPKSNSKSETHERERKMMRSALFEDYTDGEDYTDEEPRKKCKEEPCEGKDDDYCLFEKRCGDCIHGKFCTEMYSS